MTNVVLHCLNEVIVEQTEPTYNASPFYADSGVAGSGAIWNDGNDSTSATVGCGTVGVVFHRDSAYTLCESLTADPSTLVDIIVHVRVESHNPGGSVEFPSNNIKVGVVDAHPGPGVFAEDIIFEANFPYGIINLDISAYDYFYNSVQRDPARAKARVVTLGEMFTVPEPYLVVTGPYSGELAPGYSTIYELSLEFVFEVHVITGDLLERRAHFLTVPMLSRWTLDSIGGPSDDGGGDGGDGGGGVGTG